MATFGSIEKRITKEFVEAWSNFAPLFFVNLTVDENSLVEYVRLQVIPATSNQPAFGAVTQLKRVEGIVTVQVFVKANTGTGRVLEISDKVMEALQLKIFSDPDLKIQFRTGYQNQINMTTNQSYLQVNVIVPFWADYR